jgi:hypothetical protein
MGNCQAKQVEGGRAAQRKSRRSKSSREPDERKHRRSKKKRDSPPSTFRKSVSFRAEPIVHSFEADEV